MNDRRRRLRVELLSEALRVSGEVRLRVFGGSMWPWVRGGDTLVVRRPAPGSLRRGEIAVFEREGQLIVHRLLRVRRHKDSAADFITKGDTLPAADPPFTAKEFFGRVEAIERQGKRIDLTSLSAAALGRISAALSGTSRVWYPLARAARCGQLHLRAS